ncbi:MAG: glycosyltransferase [Thermoanaerobaculia bacterium]
MTNERPSSRLRLELQETNAELEEARRRIAWMESSRFWKIRNAWFEIKGVIRRIGPGGRGWDAAESPLSRRLDSDAPPWLKATPIRSIADRKRPVETVLVIVIANEAGNLRRTLDAVVACSRANDRLAIIDVGLAPDETSELSEFARAHEVVVERAEAGTEATEVIRRLIRTAKSDFAVLLDGSAIVTPGWLDRLVDCALSDPALSLVAPLSDTMDSALACDARGAADLATRVAADSGRLYPRLASLVGPCVLVRVKALARIEIAEPPRPLALHSADIALADDAFVLSGSEGLLFAGSSGPKETPGRVVSMIGERNRRLRERRARRLDARVRWEGKRVLFVLPVVDRGGGANVVLREARSMVEMGVDARVLNLASFRKGFERSYPEPGVPVLFADEGEISDIGARFDAVVATANRSVEWLEPLAMRGGPTLGYYIQDFEPYFFPIGSFEHDVAWNSYTAIPGMRLFTKTEWNQREVMSKRGVDCRLVGPSYDPDLFLPRLDAPPPGPVRVAAMIRPSTPRRAPERTLDVLKRLSESRRGSVDIVLFGVEPDDPGFRLLDPAFPYHAAGVVSENALSNLFNQVQVFADLSSFQAMGLTALEAMACGAAVVVPERGGASSFARHEENALIVDTGSDDRCVEALERLVDDASLRSRLADRAMRDVLSFHPDTAAIRILETLFDDA